MINKDMAELCGVLIGDGCYYKGRVHLDTTSKVFAEYFANLILKITKKKPKIHSKIKIMKKPKIRGLPPNYTFQYFRIRKGMPIPTNFVDTIEKSSQSIKLSFLQGFFNAEGCFCLYKKKKYFSIKFTNSNKNLLKKIAKILEKSNISISGIYDGGKWAPNIYNLYIYKQSEINKLTNLIKSFKFSKFHREKKRLRKWG